jgi:hypothetical protein
VFSALQTFLDSFSHSSSERWKRENLRKKIKINVFWRSELSCVS